MTCYSYCLLHEYSVKGFINKKRKDIDNYLNSLDIYYHSVINMYLKKTFMNNLDKQYQDLLKTIIEHGVDKKDRTGTGTKSIFGYTIRHNMKNGFPLLTTKKMAWKSIVTELLWFLRGDTNIKYLVDNGCHIWDGDAYKNYLKESANSLASGFSKEQFINLIKTDNEFAKTWGELGPIYGAQWRGWGDGGTSYWVDKNDEVRHKHITHWPEIDQIANLINELKTNPDSRRLMVNAWNVGELDQMVLPPCHYGFQVYTRELTHEERISTCLSKRPESKFAAHEDTNETLMDDWGIPKRAISLMFNMRSNDVPLGLPFNIASYGLLLEIIAKQVNMIADELIANLGDAHIYLNQIDGVKEQLKREPFELPKLKILNNQVDDIAHYEIDDFVIENYKYHPAIKIPLSN